MDEFQGAGMTLRQVDTGDATIVDLTEELTEVRAPLVPYPCLWEESGFVACLHDAVGEVDILAKAHLGKTAQLVIDITTDAHIEGTGVELVEFCLSASDATCGEERGHGVGYGLLNRGKGGMGCIRPPKGCDAIGGLQIR